MLQCVAHSVLQCVAHSVLQRVTLWRLALFSRFLDKEGVFVLSECVAVCCIVLHTVCSSVLHSGALLWGSLAFSQKRECVC